MSDAGQPSDADLARWQELAVRAERQYLEDAVFHAMVELVVQRRVRDRDARIAELTAEVERLRATRERVEWVNCWTNEHGEQFVLLGDLLAALDGPR